MPPVRESKPMARAMMSKGWRVESEVVMPVEVKDVMGWRGGQRRNCGGGKVGRESWV